MTPRQSTSDVHAVGQFIVDIFRAAEATWPVVLREARSLAPDLGVAELEADKWAALEFGLASLAIESQAIRNLLSAELAERVIQVLAKLLQQADDFGGESMEAFEMYRGAWRDALGVGEQPPNAVAGLLCDRLGLDSSLQIGKTTIRNPIVVMMLGDALARAGGGWWQQFLADHELQD